MLHHCYRFVTATLLMAFSLVPGNQALRTTSGTVSSDLRKRLLEGRRKAVMAHNLMGTSLWTAELNDFSDKTDTERSQFRSYRNFIRKPGMGAYSFMELHSETHHHRGPSSFLELSAQTVDRRKSLKSSEFVRMQGNCGSCWAVAAVGALEMRLEMEHGNATQLSWEELVDCVPNRYQCGGDGGCSGATAELAMEYVQLHGIASAHDYKEDLADVGRARACRQGNIQKTMQVKGFVQLPVNEAMPVLQVISSQGPVVSAVDSRDWFEYGYGIFDSCQPDAIVDHAILIVGYGRDDTEYGEKLYWLIRNSWGEQWGEEGHIRLLRHRKNTAYCGTDDDPQRGSGCVGGPSQVEVCGMCGILSDSVYPLETKLLA